MCDIDSEDAGMSPVSETGKDRLSDDSTDEEADFDDISIDLLSDTDEYERKPITAEQKTKKQESRYKMSDIGDEEPSLSPVSETHQGKQSEDRSDGEADFDDVSLEISPERDEYEREPSICDLDGEEPGLSPLSETGKDRLSDDSTDEEADFNDIPIDLLSYMDEYERKPITAEQETKKQESRYKMSDIGDEEPSLSPVSETHQGKQSEDTSDEEADFDDVSLEISSEIDEYEREPSICDIDGEEPSLSPLSETGKGRLSDDSTDEEADFNDIPIDLLSYMDEYKRKPITAEQKTKKQESRYKMSDIGDEEPSLSPVSETHQGKQSEDRSDGEADFDDVSLEISPERDEYEREPSICDIDGEEPGLSPLSETGKDRLSDDSTDEEADFNDIPIDLLSDTDEYKRTPITAEQKTKKQESGYKMSDIGDEEPSLSPVSETHREKQSEDTSDEEADFNDVSLDISLEIDEYEREPSICDIDGEEPSLSPVSETHQEKQSEDTLDEEADFDDVSLEISSESDEYEREPISPEQQTKKQEVFESVYKINDKGLKENTVTEQDGQKVDALHHMLTEKDREIANLTANMLKRDCELVALQQEKQSLEHIFLKTLRKKEKALASCAAKLEEASRREGELAEQLIILRESNAFDMEHQKHQSEALLILEDALAKKDKEIANLVEKHQQELREQADKFTSMRQTNDELKHHTSERVLTEKDREIASLTANNFERDRELVALRQEKESLEQIHLEVVQKKEKTLACCVAKLEEASRREGELVEQLKTIKEHNTFHMEREKHQSEALLILEDALAKKDKEIANLMEKHQQELREQADKFTSMRQTNDELKQHTMERILTEKDNEIATLTANNFERDREVVALRQEKESLEQIHLEVVQKKEKTLACCVAKLEEASRREGELVEQLRTIKEHNTFHMKREKHQSEALLILEDALAKKDKEIANLMEKHQQELREQADKFTSMRQTNDELKQHTMERILTEKDNEIATLTANNFERDREVVALRQEKESLEQIHLEVVQKKEKTLACCVAKLEEASRREGELVEQLRTIKEHNTFHMEREKHQSEALLILEDALAKKDKEIANLMEKHQQELREQADKFTSMRQTNDELKQHTMERILTEKDNEIATLTANKIKSDREVVALRQEKESLEQSHLKIVRKKEKTLARCVAKLEETSRREGELAEQLRTLQECNALNMEREKHQSEALLLLEDALAKKDKEIANLMEKHQQELLEQADKLTSMGQTNDELKQHTLERVLKEKDREIASQTAIMVERDRELVALQQEKESLEHTFLKVLRKKEKALARCVVKLEEASRREVELAEQLRTLKEHNKCDVELTKHHSKKFFLEDALATKEKEIANLMEKHHQEKEDVKKHYVSKLEEASRREEELNERLMRLTERNALDVVRENKSLLILQAELIEKDREIERLVEKHHRELLKRCSNY
ncbi:putative leucine-rich repeat-containing protein DDB_G0290503 [Cyprinodon tularosa]|uniref:putative leucine-rich repeat-containing protein DDB_G0290503 n=1 Tax=Cyprinodon tularosa TaxID=77115 RepID=UPI0018E2187E|nr:putative leucine-rich repeat-containing protein DDB_G0290503 [Cyprinodon tularosa]